MVLKRLAALALSLMLFTAPALAVSLDLDALLGPAGAGYGGEAAEFALLEDAFFVYEDFMGTSGKYAAVLENKSGKAAMLTTVTLELLDKDGTVVHSAPLYSTVPLFVAPGGIAVTESSYLTLTPEQAQQVASWKLSFAGSALGEGDGSLSRALPAKAAYAEEMTTDFTLAEKPLGTLLVTVENDAQETAFDARVIVLLRDGQGKLLTSVSNAAIDVGIPAGGSIVMKSSVQTGVLEALNAAGHSVAEAEAHAFVDIAQ